MNEGLNENEMIMEQQFEEDEEVLSNEEGKISLEYLRRISSKNKNKSSQGSQVEGGQRQGTEEQEDDELFFNQNKSETQKSSMSNQKSAT